MRDADATDSRARRTAPAPSTHPADPTDPTGPFARGPKPEIRPEIRLIPGVRTRHIESMATPKPPPRMMARPAPRARPMATPFAPVSSDDETRPYAVTAPCAVHRAASDTWRARAGATLRRRAMARCPDDELLLAKRAPNAGRSPRIPMLAGDRLGAPALVLAVLILTSLAAALPGGAGSAQATGGTNESGAVSAAEGQWAAAGFVGPVARQASVQRSGLLAAEEAAAATGLATGEVAPGSATFAADGTLIKPFATDTQVPTISDRVRTYRVRQGDSLTGIAHRFGLHMMTLWWANKLTGKDELKVGQELIIPPADGILHTVRDGDTLESLARKYEVPPEAIVKYNEIQGTTLIIGQQLLLPGGEGAPIHVARERARTAAAPTRTGSSTTRSSGDRGRALRWPVLGGHINQYFHYGHYAIDIGAGYGTPVVAAAGGRVIFAGWRNNGGGYQVWISHGGNRYTTYNHMSSLSVGSGTTVSRGQRVGRIGSTGWASGPHLHFEVWIGQIWSGGYRVNPLNYL